MSVEHLLLLRLFESVSSLVTQLGCLYLIFIYIYIYNCRTWASRIMIYLYWRHCTVSSFKRNPLKKTALQGVLYNTPHTKEVALVRARVFLIPTTRYTEPTLFRSQLIRSLDNPDRTYFKWHMPFSTADESLCADDGADWDGTCITLLPSFLVVQYRWQPVGRMPLLIRFICALTEAEIAADVRLRLWLKDLIMNHGNPQLRNNFLAP
jgi:hypothetical protein